MLAGAIQRLGRTRTALLVAVLVIVAALLLVLIEGGQDEESGQVLEVTPLSKAANKTAGYPGARMLFDATYELPADAGTMTMRGEGAFNNETGLGQVTMRIVDVPSAVEAQLPPGSREVEEVVESSPERNAMYMRSDLYGSALPDGAEWMMIDLGDQVSSQSQNLDPSAQLEQLRDVSDFSRLGREDVRNVATTHYSATIDQRAQVERLRDQGEDEAADSLEQVLDAEIVGETLEMEVWVDNEDVVRRYTVALPFSMGVGDPSDSTMEMTVDLFDFGAKPKIELPPERDVYDATDLAQLQIDELADE